jgi:hypothetical protein
VPRRWAEDPPLGDWLKSQRKFKRKLDRGEPCQGMTPARAARLEALGVAWEISHLQRIVRLAVPTPEPSPGLAAEIEPSPPPPPPPNLRPPKSKFSHTKQVEWDAQLAQLAAYKAQHGHCNVPHHSDPKLSRWVRTQREHKRETPGISMERVARLDELGFTWQPKHGGRRKAPLNVVRCSLSAHPLLPPQAVV